MESLISSRLTQTICRIEGTPDLIFPSPKGTPIATTASRAILGLPNAWRFLLSWCFSIGLGVHNKLCKQPGSAFSETGRDSTSLTSNVGVKFCRASWPVPPAEDSGSPEPSPCRKLMGKCLGQPEGTSADRGGEPDREVSSAGLCGFCVLLHFCVCMSEEPGNSPSHFSWGSHL